MLVIHDPLSCDQPPHGAVLSIGNFDVVHIGHQAVLRHVVERARGMGTTAAAMTLEPHPGKVLRPDLAPRLLTTLHHGSFATLTLIGPTLVSAIFAIP